jgi:hypothetical protein
LTVRKIIEPKGNPVEKPWSGGIREIQKIEEGLGLFRARSIAALQRRVRSEGAGAESGAQNHSVEGDLP